MEKEEYLVEGEFIFHSFIPAKLEVGMKFITKRTVLLPEPELSVVTLTEVPENEEEFMKVNGAPVTINIITTGEDGEIIALHDEIGIFDYGNGNLIPITDDQINHIINQFNGVMNVESDETGDPILYEGKVIISYLAVENGEDGKDPEQS